MSYRTVEVDVVGRDQVKWFRLHRTYPVEVQVNQRSAIFGDVRFDLHPLSNGRTAVSKVVGEMRVVVGEFDKDTIHHTISRDAARDVRVLRAAIVDGRYDVPVAIDVGKGLVHPGECCEQWRKGHPSTKFKEVMSVRNEEETCLLCDEGFE